MPLTCSFLRCDILNQYCFQDHVHPCFNISPSCEFQHHIEMKLYSILGQESLVFNCDGVAFVIDFKNMTQENTKTRQCTQVKRRPKVFDFDKLFKRFVRII